MKIFAKLMLGFGFIALICALVSAIGWYGIDKTGHNLKEIAEVNLPEVEGLGMVMEAMNGIKSAERTILNPYTSLKDRQHEYDNLSQRWKIFDEGWKKYTATAKNDDEIAARDEAEKALDAWKVEHRKLVDLIKTVNIDNLQRIRVNLLSQENNHINWVRQVEGSVTSGKTFTGQLDPQLCGLGRWLSVVKTDNPDFNAILAKFKEPHEKLHADGAKIKKLLAAGARNQAALLLRQDIYPSLIALQAVFHQADDYVGDQMLILEEAQDIGTGSEREAFNTAMAKIYDLAQQSAQATDQLTAGAEQAANRSKMLALIAVFLGVLFALGLGLISAREISRPMIRGVRFAEEIAGGRFDNRLRLNRRDEIGQFGTALDKMADSLSRHVKVAKTIASGDLTGKITLASDEDALGQALKTMQRDLLTTIGQTKLASNEIANGAQQVADSSQALAQGATEQAGSLEEISSAMTQIASQTKMTAENAGQAREISNAAQAAADHGTDQMQQMMLAMEEIRAAGQSVANVIKVIDEIAFQTNMLALNAAVEAAHAGQHGKGFAVVAEEVRNLAARSAKAAKETADLIAGSVSKTANGAKIAEQTAAALGQIMDGVSQTADLVHGIAEAAQEQSLGIEQVTQGLQQIDQVTQQNSATAEEGAAAAEQLSGQAAQLRQLLQKFRIKQGQARQLAGPAGLQSEECGDGPAATSLARPALPERISEEENAEADPSRIIPLDDTEFGRY